MILVHHGPAPNRWAKLTLTIIGHFGRKYRSGGSAVGEQCCEPTVFTSRKARGGARQRTLGTATGSRRAWASHPSLAFGWEAGPTIQSPDDCILIVPTLAAEVHCTIRSIHCKSVVIDPPQAAPLTLESSQSATNGAACKRPSPICGEGLFAAT